MLILAADTKTVSGGIRSPLLKGTIVMSICLDCFESHTAHCFFRAADYLENCPEHLMVDFMRNDRMQIAEEFRFMGQTPELPEYQQARNMLAFCVAGIPRMA